MTVPPPFDLYVFAFPRRSNFPAVPRPRTPPPVTAALPPRLRVASPRRLSLRRVRRSASSFSSRRISATANAAARRFSPPTRSSPPRVSARKPPLSSTDQTRRWSTSTDQTLRWPISTVRTRLRPTPTPWPPRHLRRFYRLRRLVRRWGIVRRRCVFVRGDVCALAASHAYHAEVAGVMRSPESDRDTAPRPSRRRSDAGSNAYLLETGTADPSFPPRLLVRRIVARASRR